MISKTKILFLLLLPIYLLHAQTKFAAIGDFGKAGSNELNVSLLVKSWNPDFVITLGDNNYENGEAATIDENIGQYYQEYIYPYFGTYGSGSPDSINHFFPTLGNHDWNTPNVQPHLDYFTLPGNERYYDIVIGDIHFFMLDSDESEPDSVAYSSVQGQWFQNAIAGSSSKWKIVCFHHAPYSSGDNHGSTIYMQWPFKELGVDAVLAGHDHVYERLIVDSLVYFVNGLGGKSRYTFGPPLPESIVRYRDKYGAMLMTAIDTQLTFSFYSVDSELIDFYEIIRLNPTVPNVPTNLIAAAVSQTQIDLSWQDNSSNEDGFKIESRMPPSTTWTEIAIVGANATSYNNSGLTVNTDYCYQVRAYNTGGSSSYSNEACAITNPTVPTPPSNLTSEATGVNEVTLNWTDNSSNEAVFIIERENATLQTFTIIDSVSANATSYIDNTVSQGVSYNYRVSAFNISGQSGYSNVSYVTSILPAPTNLVGQIIGGPPFSVVLNWQEVSNNELGFVIERDTVGLGNFETLDSVASNVTSYEDTNFVMSIGIFYYRIFALSQDTVSDYSNIAEIIIPVELVSFSASVVENSVTISWFTATETNNSGFELERKLDKIWEKLAFIEGRGSTTEESNYKYIDEFKYEAFKGVILYRLKQIDFSGAYEYSDIIEISVDFTPKNFVLYQNYPNPFNPETRIDFTLPEKRLVSLRVYSTLGELVMELINEVKEAGSYSVIFDASKLPSGVYIYRLQTSSFSSIKKMTLLK